MPYEELREGLSDEDVVDKGKKLIVNTRIRYQVVRSRQSHK
jgi:hypothetical protein